MPTGGKIIDPKIKQNSIMLPPLSFVERLRQFWTHGENRLVLLVKILGLIRSKELPFVLDVLILCIQ